MPEVQWRSAIVIVEGVEDRGGGGGGGGGGRRGIGGGKADLKKVGRGVCSSDVKS